MQILGIAQAKSNWSSLSSELCGILMPNILLSNNPNSAFVLHKLWSINPAMLVRGMVDLYNKNPSSLSRILEIATQDLKVTRISTAGPTSQALTSILESRPFAFSIELAALASRRDILNLEKWLQEKINDNGNPFVKAVISYLREKVLKAPKSESTARPLEIFATFYGCLQANRK